IIMPYLRHHQIAQLSSVVISHDDNDHAGGLSALQTQIPFNVLIVSPTADYGTDRCFRNLSWRLGDAELSVLSPQSGVLFESDNNNSCVVLIDIYGKQILLTGDIEIQAERAIVNHYPSLRADILVVPHHGSETSSSRGFISQIRPKIAINSSAYRNRFGLPSTKVIKRYQQNDVLFYDTQTDGAIEIIISEDGDMQISAYRQQNPALWGRNCYISQNYFVIQNEKDLNGC
ncbi:MAG: MBL fold metallo-hydrolase, partial [Gammaproteobacteria bacterium]|nr:MBL fold metallo-hydrolase [Gammaproteobacteria bacterium]NNJ72430.1 MBL fold metallo-hydrolase [Enterobacterales bacterium]